MIWLAVALAREVRHSCSTVPGPYRALVVVALLLALLVLAGCEPEVMYQTPDTCGYVEESDTWRCEP